MGSIKNYTSSVPADRSIMEVERILIKMGASHIAKEYDPDGKISCITFSIRQSDSHVPIRLPAKSESIKKIILNEYRRSPSKAQIEMAELQAERTAWKNVREWVELQATMIRLEQVEFMEVFMPYVYNLNQRKTFFEMMKEKNYKALLS